MNESDTPVSDLERPERVSGTVQDADDLPRIATMAVGGEAQRFSAISGSFTLIGEDGRSVEIRLTDATKLGPPVTRRGPWGEIMDDPLAADERLAERAPGNHVEVELSGVVLAPGDKVIVEGTAEYTREGGGYRDDGERVPSRVHASHVAVGTTGGQWLAEVGVVRDAKALERANSEREYQLKQAEEAQAREAGQELSLSWCAASSVLALSAWTVSILLHGALWNQEQFGPRYWFLNTLAIGLMAASLALLLWTRRRFPPRMVEAAGEQTMGLPWAVSSAVVWYVVAIAVQMVLFGTFASMPSRIGGSGIGALAFVVPFMATSMQLVLWVRRMRAATAPMILLGASRRADGDGWGYREGRVARGELVRTCTYALEAPGFRVGAWRQSKHVEWVGKESGGSGSVVIQTGERTIEVLLAGHARWGTTRRSVDPGSPTRAALTETLKRGDDVLVLGRVTADEMRAGGPESLILFAAHRGSARAALRREIWKYRLGLLAHAILIAVAFGFAGTIVWASGL